MGLINVFHVLYLIVFCVIAIQQVFVINAILTTEEIELIHVSYAKLKNV